MLLTTRQPGQRVINQLRVGIAERRRSTQRQREAEHLLRCFIMATKHDVQDLGMVSLKLPDGQELELPLLKVSCLYRIEIGLGFRTHHSH